MASQILDYKKISFSDLMTIIDSKVTHNLSEIEQRISSVENATSTLATTVSEDNATINNIITTGFNLIGIDN